MQQWEREWNRAAVCPSKREVYPFVLSFGEESLLCESKGVLRLWVLSDFLFTILYSIFDSEYFCDCLRFWTYFTLRDHVNFWCSWVIVLSYLLQLWSFAQQHPFEMMSFKSYMSSKFYLLSFLISILSFCLPWMRFWRIISHLSGVWYF